MKNKRTPRNIAAVVSEALTPVINDLGYSVWDIEYVKEGADYFLRFTIDREEGISIEDCEKVHRAIDPLLDELDPIEDAYHLEVSSPGIERDIKADWHYEVCEGLKAELRLYAPLDEYPGKKVFVGILGPVTDGAVMLTAEDGEVRIPLASVSKAKTVYDF